MSLAIPELGVLSRREQLRASLTGWMPWVGKGSLAVLDQGLISGSNFLIGILLARWLAPEAYGAYALAFSIFLFLSGFQNALLLEPMSVFGPASYKDHLPAYLGKLLRLHFALTFALALLLALGASCFLSFFGNRAVPYALFGAALATPWILSFWLCRRSAYLELRPALAVRSAAAYCLLVLLLLFLCERLGRLSPFAAFLLQAVASVAASAILLASIRPQLTSIEPNPSMRMILNQHWKYGRWVVATTFVCWLSGGAYYVLVGALFRMQDVAALRALQNFVLPMTQFITAISLLLLPWASAQLAEQGGAVFKRNIRKITLLFVSGAAVYLVCIVLFGHWLMETLYAGRYVQVAYLLPLAGLPLLMGAASQAPGIALAAMQAPSKVFWGYAVAAATTILVGVPLTRYRGLVGAMSAMVISSSAFFAVVVYYYKTSLRRVTDVEPRGKR
jgi:O-antigen/teichoic acid export membrane protein